MRLDEENDFRIVQASWVGFRFGEESELSQGLPDERFGPIHTYWAVLLYLASVIGYLVFLVWPTPILPPHDSFAIEVSLPTPASSELSQTHYDAPPVHMRCHPIRDPY